MAGEWSQFIASHSTNIILSSDILKHYLGCCPWCGYDTHMCPGCGGVSVLWPEIFASCGRDQACPVCMGLAFAERDKGYLDALEWMDKGGKLPRHRVDEAADVAAERFECIQARHEEMGYLDYPSAKEMLQSWMDVYLTAEMIVD